MNNFNNFEHPYPYNPLYKKRGAYFCMEFGIDQALKIYSGGLGYLAGSHMRSAYELRQNMVGIGMLWKYGYYDQVREGDKSMKAHFIEKDYSFLQDTGITFDIEINRHPVKVKAWYLAPEVFGTAPIFLLSTDLPENDWLARTITHRLYDSNIETKVAQCVLLGVGGAKLLDLLNYNPEFYHLNEAHALPAAFYLYKKYGQMSEVTKRLVFTTHTPVAAGNEKHDIRLLNKMGFFCGTPVQQVRQMLDVQGDVFDHTLSCLRLARIANGVSRMHGEVANQMWGGYHSICPIISITNSQNHKYWADTQLDAALKDDDDARLVERKATLKGKLFSMVANQTGKIFDPKVLTIVWARRFAPYKRADLITRDMRRFERLVTDTERPVQVIWAGKPYPMDYDAISKFNGLVHLSKQYNNCAVLVGYELFLSKRLKQGSDIWLNTPRVPREASGTSGMTAAMNASVNFSTQDGWIPEFAQHGVNSFIVPLVDANLPEYEQDAQDMKHFLDQLEFEILPMYYDEHEKWLTVVKNSMNQVVPYFDADRMAHEYYEKLYQAEGRLAASTPKAVRMGM
ncbi:MAG: alpha-glucan family phosphorylase [Bacteroidota bacterium]